MSPQIGCLFFTALPVWLSTPGFRASLSARVGVGGWGGQRWCARLLLVLNDPPTRAVNTHKYISAKFQVLSQNRAKCMFIYVFCVGCPLPVWERMNFLRFLEDSSRHTWTTDLTRWTSELCSVIVVTSFPPISSTLSYFFSPNLLPWCASTGDPSNDPCGPLWRSLIRDPRVSRPRPDAVAAKHALNLKVVVSLPSGLHAWPCLHSACDVCPPEVFRLLTCT